MSEILLQMKNIRKEFSGVCVLENVEFDVRSPEIHASPEIMRCNIR